MKHIVFLATEWGPVGGGINSLNWDLCTALARLGTSKITCLIAGKAWSAQHDASGVQLLTVAVNRLEEIAAERILKQFENQLRDVTLWVGHDVVSGELSRRLSKVTDTPFWLMHHMSYADYYSYKTGRSADADEKANLQADLIRSAPRVVAVGPLLAKRARDLNSAVLEFVPGLQKELCDRDTPPPVAAARALTFGRMDGANDRIKQGSLAVTAFAEAARRSRAASQGSQLGANGASITIVGIGDKSEEDRLRKLVEDSEHSTVQLIALPYDDSRSSLQARIQSSNVVLMLSWHDGFGLTAFEAIAAGVPLVLTKHCGAYQYLEGIGCDRMVYGVDVQGNAQGDSSYSESDVEVVASRLVEIYKDINLAVRAATTLRNCVLDRVGDWATCARRFDGYFELLQVPHAVVSQESETHCGSVELDVVVRQGHREWLQDLGLLIKVSESSDKLLLDDVYVDTDLIEVTPDVGASRRRETLSVDRLADIVVERGEYNVCGDAQCGKTVLAKKLTQLLLERGLVPVYLRDLRTVHKGKQLDAAISRAVADQYERPGSVEFGRVAREKKVLIVDDWHLVEGVKSSLTALRAELAARFQSVVLIGMGAMIEPDELSKFAGTDSLRRRRFDMLPLGYEKRDLLVRRWSELVSRSEAEHQQEQRELVRLLNSIVGKNVVPSYPTYLLSIMQAHRSLQVDVSAGSHGYYYELLIRCSLAKGTPQPEFEIHNSYLSYIAYHMMTRNLTRLTAAELRECHRGFELLTDIDVPFETVVDRLASRGIVKRDVAGAVEFAYSYIYYYFAAAALRDRIHTEDAKRAVDGLCDSLYEERSSNVILFLAHLCKDPYVFDTLNRVANQLYAEHAPMRLEKSEFVFDSLQSLEDSTAEFLDRGSEEMRRKALRDMDQADAQEEVNNDKIRADARLVRSAVAMIKIMGQMLRNFLGGLDAARKLELVNACFGLGRRLLQWNFGYVAKHQDEIVHEYARAFKNLHPESTVAQLIVRASDTISELLALSVFGVVRVVSSSVGDARLERTLLKANDQDAPLVRLYVFSVMMEHEQLFPHARLAELSDRIDGNTFAVVCLRYAVSCHMHLTTLPSPERQRICAALKMRYQFDPVGSTQRLLPPKK